MNLLDIGWVVLLLWRDKQVLGVGAFRLGTVDDDVVGEPYAAYLEATLDALHVEAFSFRGVACGWYQVDPVEAYVAAVESIRIDMHMSKPNM